MRYHLLKDGEWVELESFKQRFMCCDCGLVHDYEYRIVEGKIQFRCWRNKRASAGARGKYYPFKEIK